MWFATLVVNHMTLKCWVLGSIPRRVTLPGKPGKQKERRGADSTDARQLRGAFAMQLLRCITGLISSGWDKETAPDHLGGWLGLSLFLLPVWLW
jgi:hypothetical protein